jgi:phosphoribosylglycinamide formyltransferase-1
LHSFIKNQPLSRSSGGLNLCVLASGEGSNLKAILRAQKSRKIKSRVVLVISNNSKSGALRAAHRNNIPAYHLSQIQFNSEKKFVGSFLSLLRKFEIDLILLAGYMKMLSPRIVKRYKNRIMNIHPALLPQFGGKGMYGMNVHNTVIESGNKMSGATVHLVDEVYDNGATLIQKQVRVSAGDTPETLQKKVLKVEHKIYWEAIKLIEQNKVKFAGRKVVVEN